MSLQPKPLFPFAESDTYKRWVQEIRIENQHKRYTRLMVLAMDKIDEPIFKLALQLIPSEDHEMNKLADVLMDEIEHQQWKNKQLI